MIGASGHHFLPNIPSIGGSFFFSPEAILRRSASPRTPLDEFPARETPLVSRRWAWSVLLPAAIFQNNFVFFFTDPESAWFF